MIGALVAQKLISTSQEHLRIFPRAGPPERELESVESICTWNSFPNVRRLFKPRAQDSLERFHLLPGPGDAIVRPSMLILHKGKGT